jgi:hypothetical protein
MRVKRYIAPLICAVLLFGSCVKEFDPPSKDFEELLTVEAFLSDEDKPFEVILSRSVPIDTSGFVPESGAGVSLIVESGESYALWESEPGIYQYAGQINPQIGKKYKLRIQTVSGSQYESDEVTMRDTPDIGELRYEFEEKPNGIRGVQFYLNTKDDANQTKYYKWEWDETWVIRTPYDSYLKFEDGRIQVRSENINTCYNFYKSTVIDIGTSKNLSQDVISDFPIKFVSTQSNRLKVRYSFNVKQISMSEESYTFWKELQKITENLGSLFDPQPSVVQGNIHNLNNGNEVVIGYFDAAAVKGARIFVDNRDLPTVQFPNSFQYCTDSTVSAGQIPDMVEDHYILIGETVNDAGFPAYLMSAPSCVDCRFYGTNIKPDYWY